ncbi:MAG: DUF3794 domain-containing protein [Maledivibacter sp.]|jgi:carbonic anhydrase/acetyltransferase-like protein (isoleucine patch superfamily)|nr:DUF3794 domain-containing protein [Maledivibacter sp.]
MSVGLIKEMLKLDRMVGSENVQALVESDIVVPDSKPDIHNILSAEGNVNISDREIMQGKIVVQGTVSYKILYTSDDQDKLLYSMKASNGFTQNIEMDNIDGMMEPEVNYNIEHMDFGIMNERKISAQTVLNLTGKVFKTEEVDIVKEVEGVEDIQALKDTVTYDNSIGNNSSQTVLRENFELGEDDAEITEVLQVNGNAVINEKKVTDNKVIIGGNVNVNMLYATDEPRNPVHELKHEIPFTHFVEVPKAENDMDCRVDVNIDEVYTDVKKNINEENKVYDVEVVLKANVKVYKKVEKEVLLDAYSPTRKLNIQTNDFKFMKNIGSNSSHAVIKETIDTPNDYPSIFKVFTVKARPVVTDYRMIENKNIIEGFIDTNVLYMADTEEMQVQSFNQEVPFRHYVEVEGMNEDMEADVKLDIQDVDFTAINSKQIEAKFSLNAHSEVNKEYEMNVLINIEDLGEVDDDDNKASITIYFVQEGDNLWDIAKRYNTTVNEILQTNEITDSEEVKAGNKIIIQKNYEYKF